MTFHKGLYCILGQTRSPEKECNIFYEIPLCIKWAVLHTLWTIPLIYKLVLIALAQMPRINAHVYVSKVRYSMGYFDSEHMGVLYQSLLYFYDNIDLQRKKCGISNLVVKGIKIQRLQVYIDNICRYMLVLIAHAQMPLIKADVGEARISMQNWNSTLQWKPRRSKSINLLCENMLIPYESICLHMHAHAALTLFYKRPFFFQSFFKNYTFFRYTIYHLFGSNKNPVVVPDLDPFCLDVTNHLTQPHSMGSNTACWFIGKFI